MSRYLVVAATAAEAAYVPPALPLLVTGVGKTAAAAATAAALATAAPDLVVNIGTAGALRPGQAGLHLPSTVVNHDISADLLAVLGIPTEDTLEVARGDGTVLATGDTFVTDPLARDRLAERAHLVDMEGFAVVYACRSAGVAVRLVKSVSDDADEGAMDWPTAVDASARALGRWLAEHL